MSEKIVQRSDSPLFSIAIPTYNNSNTLEKSLVSCINQDYDGDYEIVVLDNCSTDNTPNILDKYSDHLITRRLNRNLTLSQNHNECLRLARGEYILFCHSDDELMIDALTKISNILELTGYPKNFATWGRSFFRDFYSNWNKASMKLNEISSGMHSVDVFVNGGLTPSGTCFSRESFLQHGGFTEVKHQLQATDTVTMLKLAIRGFEFLMSDRIIFRRIEAGTATGKKYNYQNQKNALAEALHCLRHEINPDEYNWLVNRIQNSSVWNYQMMAALVENKSIPKADARNRMFKTILKNPLVIYDYKFRYLLINLITVI